MPELAEVETVRRQILKKAKKKKINRVTLDPSDRFLFAFTSPDAVKKSLEGARIVGAGRKGKYFWLELDRKPWPLFHLGMSGNLSFLNPKSKAGRERVWGGARLWRERDKDFKLRLMFSRLLLDFEGGIEMAFLDPRRFGRLWLTDDPWQHPRIMKLGYDPLIDFPTAQVLSAKLLKRKKAIKAVLLDQSLFAGIGNWLADEILYQARLSPHLLASKLSPKQCREIHKHTLAVVRKAVDVSADYERFPRSWIFHSRWGKAKNAKTSRGRIVFEEVGGRTTAWVPGWQK